jgi:hypothetical protein
VLSLYGRAVVPLQRRESLDWLQEGRRPMSTRKILRILQPAATIAAFAFVLCIALLPTAIPGIMTATIVCSIVACVTLGVLFMVLSIGGER